MEDLIYNPFACRPICPSTESYALSPMSLPFSSSSSFTKYLYTYMIKRID